MATVPECGTGMIENTEAQSLIPATNPEQEATERTRLVVEAQKKLHIAALAKEFHSSVCSRFMSVGDDFYFATEKEEAAFNAACSMLTLVFLQEECV